MKVYQSITELIGNTPLLELCGLETELKLKAAIYAKLESFNVAGSVKDRVALHMIEDAEEKGMIKPGATIIEPTSGNTGIGLAAIAVAKGYRMIIVMPETMSIERRNIIEAYGAEIVLTEGYKGMRGSIERASELAEEIEGSFIPGQFENPANPEAHRLHTGPEIWEALEGRLDAFFAGVGTGGTISGVGEYLKGKNPDIRIYAIEPSGSPMLSAGKSGLHKIQGIGAGFIPKILNRESYDEVITVSNEAAFEYGRRVVQTDAILAGISGGAVLKAAADWAGLEENKGKTGVVLLPDGGDRYYSTELFS